jgi:hypothetical protein
MARMISTSTYTAPSQAATLKALAQRQEEYSNAAAKAAQMRQIANPWQGAAQLMEVFSNNLNAGRAERQEAEGRQKFAQLLSGVDPTQGATPEQIQQMYTLDPDQGALYAADAMKLIRDRQAAQTARSEKIADQGTQFANQRTLKQMEIDAANAREGVKAPTVVELYDDKGRPYKATWDPVAKTYTPQGGSKAQSEQIRRPTEQEISEWNLPPDKPHKMVSKDGGQSWAPEAIGGGGVTVNTGTPKLTEGQATTTGYYIRAQAADRLVQPLEKLGTEKRTQLGDVPFVGNYMITDDQQKYRQAKMDFITAVLRRQSGATIQPSEFDTEDAKYFPQPGDSDVVIEQKRQARQQEIEALRIGAGAGSQYGEMQRPKDIPENLWNVMTDEEKAAVQQ